MKAALVYLFMNIYIYIYIERERERCFDESYNITYTNK